MLILGSETSATLITCKWNCTDLNGFIVLPNFFMHGTPLITKLFMNYLKRIACICCQTRDGGEGTCLIIFYWFECISLDLRVFMYWGKDGKNLSLAYLIGNLSKLYNVIKNLCGNISVSFVRLSVSDFLFPIFWNYVNLRSKYRWG